MGVIIDQSNTVKTNSGGKGYKFRMVVTINETNIAGNYWNITIDHYGHGYGGWDYSSHSEPNSLIKTTIDGTTTTRQITGVPKLSDSSTWKHIGTWTGNIYANADGNKYVTFIAKYAPNTSTGYMPVTNQISVGYQMPTIPRYANITSFSVSKRDETSVSFSYSTDATLDYAWYSKDNGANWYTLPNNNVITGLSANTSYNFKLRVRRADSQLTTDSGTYSQSTYNYPNATTLPQFKIGDNVTLTIYNPLSRAFTGTIYGANSTVIGTISGNGTSVTTSFTDDDKNAQFSSVKNITDGKSQYSVSITYGSQTKTTSSGNNTYYADSTENKPTFDNFTSSYSCDMTNLTNDNKVAINKQSTITFTILTGATPVNCDSISKYTITWGDISQDITDINNSAILVKGNGNIIQIQAFDTRGFTNTTTVTLQELVNYTSPIECESSAHRQNGVETTTFINVSGTIYYDTFGINGESNNINSIKYSVVNGTTEDVSLSLSTISYTSESLETHTKNFTLENVPIHENGSSGGFPSTNSYRIKVDIEDTLGTIVTVYCTINSGTFATHLMKDSNGYHQGINGVADDNYTQNVHGSINCSSLYINDVQMLDYMYPIGSIYTSTNSTSPAELYGGTWTTWGSGRVPVGVDTSDSDFNTVEKTGGEKRHTLSVNEMPSHAHPIRVQWGDMSTGNIDLGGSGTKWKIDRGDYTSSTGGSQSHNNLQPYITWYMWKRTA